MSDEPSEQAMLELLNVIKLWQDKYDVRPSALVKALQDTIKVVSPSKRQ